MNLCKYSNMFGKPNTGIHKYRLFDIAILDVLLTIIIGIIIHKFTGYSMIYILFVLFLLGIVMHRLFCVRTTIDKILFR